MPRLRIFAIVLVTLAAIDSAVAVGLREDPAVSMAAIFARAVTCVLAGYAITERKADDVFVAPILVAAAALGSLLVSDVVIFLTGANRWFVPGFSVDQVALTLMALPPIASLVGAGLSLALARVGAARRLG
jgi:hypothetical protein